MSFFDKSHQYTLIQYFSIFLLFLIPLTFSDGYAFTDYTQNFNNSTSLEESGWSYFSPVDDNYTAVISNGSAYVSGSNDWQSVYGIEKTFDISTLNRMNPLFVSFDWKAESNFSDMYNSHFIVLNDNDDILYSQDIQSGRPDSSFDTDWQHVSVDISKYVEDEDSITLRYYLEDHSTTSWVKNWYDNISLLDPIYYVINPGHFTDDSEIIIIPVDESDSTDCQEIEECYIQDTIIIDVGYTVKFSNINNTTHTFTAGDLTVFESDELFFESNLFKSEDSFEWTPTETGKILYFDTKHPWIGGVIIVQESYDESNDESINTTNYASTQMKHVNLKNKITSFESIDFNYIRK